MAWLIAQMLLFLLVAAAFGGIIGWSLHALRLARLAEAAAAGQAGEQEARASVAELLAQLAQEREETGLLRVKLASGAGLEAGDPDQEGTLAWRNRYLESRVRFLEGKLADLEEAVVPEKPKEDVNDEATRLRWRNRYLEGRVRYLEEELVRGEHIVVAMPPPPPVQPTPVSDAATLERVPAGEKPATLSAPRGGRADNLKEIAGIGPKLEKMLHSLGVYHFDQLAGWTPAEIEWVNSAISFRGRIERERWVEQAQQLARRQDAPTA
ncbi:MAG: hypothetical protein GC155_17855 [Alphaproteobacteria bacterium]|nr:hypothetical protein [Alphaproteobacteria bacterium]